MNRFIRLHSGAFAKVDPPESDAQTTPSDILEQFPKIFNLTTDEMSDQFSSTQSETAKGQVDGKLILSLKKKDQNEWTEDELEDARRALRMAKLQLGRKLPLFDARSGDPTRYNVSLKNRGIDAQQLVKSGALAEMSINDFERDVMQAVEKFATPIYSEFVDGPIPEYKDIWVKDIYPKSHYAIAQIGDEVYRVDYATLDDGTIDIKAPVIPVIQQWIPVEHKIETQGKVISMANAENDEPPEWNVVIMEPGLANGFDFSEESVKNAVEGGLFEGKQGRNIPDRKHVKMEEGDFPKVFTIKDTVWNAEEKRAEGVLSWEKDQYPHYMDKKYRRALSSGEDLFPGFSFVGDWWADEANRVTKIEKVKWFDPCSDPAAGGRFISFANAKKEDTMDPVLLKVIMAMAMGLRADGITTEAQLDTRLTKVTGANGKITDFLIGFVKKVLPEALADSEVADTLQKDETMLLTWVKVALAQMGFSSDGITPKEGEEGTATPAEGALSKIDQPKLTDIERRAKEDTVRGIIRVKTTKLHKRFEDQLVEGAMSAETSGDPWTVEKLHKETDGALEAQTDIEKEFNRDEKSLSPLKVTEPEEQKIQTMCADFWCQDITDTTERKRMQTEYNAPISDHAGKISLKELFHAAGGEIDRNGNVSRRSGAFATDDVITTMHLTNGLEVRLMRDFDMPSVYNNWKEFTAIMDLEDFRQKKAAAYGGFDAFEVVPENDAFTEMEDSGGAVESYLPAKRGGILTISFEQVRNDNTGYVLSARNRMVQAGLRKRSEFAWNLITSNPVLENDAKTLFHPSRNNDISGPSASHGLGQKAMLKQRMGAMKRQLIPGTAADILALRIGYLVIPEDEDMKEMAYNYITKAAGENNAIQNYVQNEGMIVVVNPHMTDLNDWYLIANTTDIELTEMGFLDTKARPQLVTSQQEGVGKWFERMQVVIRVHDIYGGTPIRSEGFQRIIVT